jgi:hypothetical protein
VRNDVRNVWMRRLSLRNSCRILSTVAEHSDLRKTCRVRKEGVEGDWGLAETLSEEAVEQ